ncbi:MAG: FliA/WhiG family RNA polymerase sigma factor [Clostridiales bacterium]|nr:FliA/WhiG family RNA polymerase sigma factor [Clostridiales bacterium]
MQNHAVLDDRPQDELTGLWQRYKLHQDAQAKDKLLLHYVHLVKQIVRRMMPRYNNYNEYDDLVNCGIIGLIDAMEKFDLRHGVKFETYAVSRIRGEILDYMREQDWAPSSLRKKINAIAEVYEKYENVHGEPPSDEQVAADMGVNVADVRKVISKNHAFNLLYFDDANEGAYSIREVSADSESSVPESVLLKDELKSILAEIIESLPEKERLVVTLYYYEEMTLKEIGLTLGVSESRISQIHSKALMGLRSRMQQAFAI